MAEKWIYWFEELSSADNDFVGKKCANLGEMTRLGMRVPPGFAISVQGYENFMEQSGAGDEVRKYVSDNLPLLKNVKKQVEASRHIRQIIESKDMPPSMELELHEHYAELQGRVKIEKLAVAVRSSGAVSMPGQMETYLNVRGAQDVTSKIIKVWGSAFTTRAIAFRLERGMDVEKAPIGVAVLKMVNAKCAGVCLTVIPTTGDTSKMVIEGNWGLGESVVSGEITPDQFTIDKACGETETIIGDKTRMVCYASTGICFSRVPDGMRNQPCVNADELREISEIAKKVEAHFNVPQDMEWVVDNDMPFPENIYWVQTRPAKYAKKKESEAEYLAELMSRVFKM